MAETSMHVNATVKVGGKTIGAGDVHRIVIQSDLDHPDHASLTLANLSESMRHSEELKEGDPVEITLGQFDGAEAAPLFSGEVIALQPEFRIGKTQKVRLEAYNTLHRLTRGKQSRTYVDRTDKDIVDQVAQKYGLTAKFGDQPPTTKYDHVYQHNQTDLEFLRLRAARLGFEVFVDKKELNFRKRPDADSGIKLEFALEGKETTLEQFHPRLSTANQVSEVRVRSWDPVKKEVIEGVAKPQQSKLGDRHGSAVANETYQNVHLVDVDVPVNSKEEADNLAKALLQDRISNFITGEAACRGNPKIKPGIVVTINVEDKRFDGKYYIIACTHEYKHTEGSIGYTTKFKFKRDAMSGGG